MTPAQKRLSVAQAAALCGVNRNTIGYWIRSDKLHAHRVGKSYSIPVEELLFYLTSSGQNIPDELAGGNNRGPHFRAHQTCWEYFQGTDHGDNCKDCPVFEKQLEVCFPGKKLGALVCSHRCDTCRFYLEIYFPRMQFIHQISLPAAVYKGFHIWGGNSRWAELCGIQDMDIPGIGVEELCHPDSLEEVISNVKKRALGISSVPGSYNIFLKNRERGKLRVRLSVYALDEPPEAFLVIAEQ